MCEIECRGCCANNSDVFFLILAPFYSSSEHAAIFPTSLNYNYMY